MFSILLESFNLWLRINNFRCTTQLINMHMK